MSSQSHCSKKPYDFNSAKRYLVPSIRFWFIKSLIRTLHNITDVNLPFVDELYRYLQRFEFVRSERLNSLWTSSSKYRRLGSSVKGSVCISWVISASFFCKASFAFTRSLVLTSTLNSSSSFRLDSFAANFFYNSQLGGCLLAFTLLPWTTSI